MTRGYRNNNPGNIRISSEKYQGEVPGDDRQFKTFKSMAYGFRAMLVILNTYYTKYGLKTISAMIERWAPRNENDTDAYITAVSRWSGKDRTQILNIGMAADMVPVVAAMARMENGEAPKIEDVNAGWELFINSR